MEEYATGDAIGMLRGYEQVRAWPTATSGGGWVAKDDCLCGVQDEKTTLQAERPKENCAKQTAQNIADATSTGDNGRM